MGSNEDFDLAGKIVKIRGGCRSFFSNFISRMGNNEIFKTKAKGSKLQ